MIKLDISKDKFFMVSSGNWRQMVVAKEKTEAIRKAFRVVTKDKELYNISNILMVFDIDSSIDELTMEDSLKFTSILDVVDLIEDKKLARAVQGLFKND